MKAIILGSGYAGLTVAHRIREYSKDIEVQIISKSKLVRENTIFPLLLTDEVKVEDTEFDAKEAMEKKGVNFVEADVEDILLESNEVKTSKGTFDYDYLFIALGGGYEENFEKIPGHEFAFMHHTLDGFLGLKKALYEAEEGSKIFVGNAAASPIEGPSYQVALISEYILRKRGIKDREIYLATQSPKGVFGILPFDWVSDKANKYFEKRGIKILRGKYVKEVKKDKVVLNDGTEVYADVKSILPTLSAPEVVKKSGLELVNNFVKVELPSFKARKNVYALGDSAMGMVPAKTARSAMVSAENAVASFLKDVKDIYLPMYSQGVLCIMEGGDDSGILRFDKNSKEVKVFFDFGKNYVLFKKIYSKMLVNSAFNLKYHASLTI
ncbi:pyridine nucleotide-disulfide oxidoreductase [Acidianus sulfidivorans JP7]|uniref:NAD(P)/FAD-dependent oxidoreductase n=1 Tax=Acidianus sulfidivorans TaxID=312539 RepID=UPI0014437E6A|nr:FAD-dependent oxidoreductase [Acidianus sulfidivorans]AWR97899.2 pyridine nucleotide-disulfide oxidoreductase [Acidianus sulfidivorans JP7]